jgi:hypothetical protein
MLAESEPVPGSVMAIAAHLPLKRSSCSSLATAAMAELPSLGEAWTAAGRYRHSTFR